MCHDVSFFFSLFFLIKCRPECIIHGNNITRGIFSGGGRWDDNCFIHFNPDIFVPLKIVPLKAQNNIRFIIVIIYYFDSFLIVPDPELPVFMLFCVWEKKIHKKKIHEKKKLCFYLCFYAKIKNSQYEIYV